MSEDKTSIRVIQITDPHLPEHDGDTLAGADTLNTFLSTVEKIKECSLPADLIIATGDIVQNATSPHGYETFREIIEPLGIKTLVIPGNHDQADILTNTLSDGLVSYSQHFIHNNWQFIMLDSSIPHAVNGHLKTEDLDEVDRLLTENPDHHTLIAMHHQPMPIGCRWLDICDNGAIDNGNELFGIVEKHANAKVVMWGHIHQDFISSRNNVHLVGAPSTCIQFKPRHIDFCLDRLPPGYRWLELEDDGSIATGVIRTNEIPAEIDFNTNGYE